MKNLLIICFSASLIAFSGCNKEDDKFSMKNIIRASYHVITKKGITELSAEAINEEIEKMYARPEDVFQRRQTIRDQGADKSLNYRMIFEDTIDEEKYQESRTKSDPFKK